MIQMKNVWSHTSNLNNTIKLECIWKDLRFNVTKDLLLTRDRTLKLLTVVK